MDENQYPYNVKFGLEKMSKTKMLEHSRKADI